MRPPTGNSPDTSVALADMAKSLKIFFPPTRGRREIDIPELSAEELAGIDRKNLSKKQRQKTPRVKPMGRPKKYPEEERQLVVRALRQAVSEGLTLTYSDVQIGSAFEIVSERLFGSNRFAEKVRYIWRHDKNKII